MLPELIAGAVGFGLNTLFAWWVLFKGGAEWLYSRPLFNFLTLGLWSLLRWDADQIKLWVGGGWVLSLGAGIVKGLYLLSGGGL